LKWILGAALVLSTAASLLAAGSIGTPAIAHPLGSATRTATPTRSPARPSVSPTPAPTSTPTPTPRPGPPPSLAALGPGIMVSECRGATAHSVRTIFLWTPSGAGAQYLDLSFYNNGFAPGTFIDAGGFWPGMYGYVWDGLRQGVTHFARVNTLTAAGWRPSQTLSFYTPVCDAAAADPPPAPDMLALRDQMASVIDGGTIDAAVAITDLRTGEVVDISGADERLPGCTINLFGLMRVVVDLQAGKYPEPDPGDLIGQTIHGSNPITARHLIRDWVGDGDIFTGIDRVNDFMHALGMTDTQMDHPPAFPEESRQSVDAENSITALDANRGLQALWDGRVLAPFWRDYLLYKMTLVKPGLNYLIPVGTSDGAIVSHKNGFLYEEGWADNDIGIVWYERGGERYGYAISFFTENVPGKYDDIPLGQEISSLAYQWFVGRYGYP
jgi:hypothetical protein